MSSGGDTPHSSTGSGVTAVLGFWQALEAFSPQEPRSTDDVDFGAGTSKPRTTDLVLGDAAMPYALPWEYPAPTAYETGHQFSAADTTPRWRHRVSLGLVPLAQLTEELVAHFTADDVGTAELRAWAQGKYFVICSFGVGALGDLDVESFEISSVPWALGQLTSGAGHDLDGFDRFRADLQRQWLVAWQEHRHPVDRPVTVHDLEWLLDWVLDRVGWSPGPARGLWRPGDQATRGRAGTCLSYKKSPARATTPDPTILNSFFLSDLEAVRREVRGGDIGRALRQYLGLDLPETRSDVRTDPTVRRMMEHPSLRPTGRWPAASTQPLNAGQLRAIHGAFLQIGSSPGLFSVNGPPGTGKTTLLRDVVAEVVVTRAAHLAYRYRQPSDAFGPAVPIPGDPGGWRIYPLRDDLSPFGIVVTSSNNEAVFNISRQLPMHDAIATEWQDDADYFSEVATSVARGAKGSDELAWGLLAAVLGNKELRGTFAKDFWFGSKTHDEPRPSMADVLRDSSANEGWTIECWREAVRRFDVAVAAERVCRAEAIRAADTFEALSEAEAAHRRASATLADVADDAQRTDEALVVARGEAEASDRQWAMIVGQADNQRAAKPSWVDRLLRRSTLAEWREALATLNKAALEASVTAGEHRQRVDELTKMRAELVIVQEEATATIVECRRTIDAVVVARARFGTHFPCGPEASREIREMQSPWSRPEWERARTEVFLAALAVHEQFLIGARRQMRSNLAAAAKILTGALVPAQLGRWLGTAWASLFLTVPVVSTTLASFPRLFAGMGRESIGWLLVDEAGQVAPQYAVGAIWRSQRTLVVGDPFQLEPIVTIPARAVDAMAARFGVDRTWVPPDASAQTLADRANPIGTCLDELWVGAPLRVHRRCRNPMFSISNEIAYENEMVHAVEDGVPGPWWEQSTWWQVTGDAEGSQWVPEQGEVLADLLERLGTDATWFVITPFRAVAAKLRGRLERRQSRGGGGRIGTIHTFQGKEADVVFLVLGTDPPAIGSRQWAGSKPNLLNVAVTRARKAVHVIGDRELWTDIHYFATLAAELEVVEPG